MPLAYKVEELLALRSSISESAVLFDKFVDEDVVKGQSSLCLHPHRLPFRHLTSLPWEPTQELPTMFP
jgi:hypothetical protein